LLALASIEWLRYFLNRFDLRRFAWQILFRQRPVAIRFIVVRHNNRHPIAGNDRLGRAWASRDDLTGIEARVF
jgi:hypothetical protein